MTKETLIKMLQALGFTESSDKSVYICEINKYKITVKLNEQDVEKSTIHYGNKIKVHHTGICSFEKKENIVQLECVIRLLNKGYKPVSIELEKQYRLGHSDKGRLDILVKKHGKTWAMIECKTFGTEYDNERKKVISDGGQIFSYYAQNRDAKIIGIYSSTIIDSDVIYQAEFIYTHLLNKTGEASDIHKSIYCIM